MAPLQTVLGPKDSSRKIDAVDDGSSLGGDDNNSGSDHFEKTVPRSRKEKVSETALSGGTAELKFKVGTTVKKVSRSTEEKQRSNINDLSRSLLF